MFVYCRHWYCYSSGFQEMEVRNGDEAFCVNLQNKVCSCRMWELSGVPCVHAVVGYLHIGKEVDEGVSFWYSQEAWFNAYQFSIKPVLGSKYWKGLMMYPHYHLYLERCQVDHKNREGNQQMKIMALMLVELVGK